MSKRSLHLVPLSLALALAGCVVAPVVNVTVPPAPASAEATPAPTARPSTPPDPGRVPPPAPEIAGIFAGLSGMGEGLPGDQAEPGTITGLAAGPGDAVYFASGEIWPAGVPGIPQVQTRSLWRLDDAGALRRHGQVPVSAASPPRNLQVDAQGRLHFTDADGPQRVEPDGRVVSVVSEADREVVRGMSFFPASAARWNATDGRRLWAIEEDGHLAPGPEGGAGDAFPLGQDADGRFYHLRFAEANGPGTAAVVAIMRHAPATGATEAVWERGATPQRAWLEGRGRVVIQDDATGALTVRWPDGRDAALDAQLPVEDRRAISRVAVADDGTTYAAAGPRIYRLRGATATRIVGQAPGQVGTAGMTSMHPLYVAAAADGSVYVAEDEGGRLLRIDPAGEVHVVAADLPPRFAAIAVAPDGTVYALIDGTVQRLAADGTRTKVPTPAGEIIRSLAIGADGRLLVTQGDRLWRMGPGGEDPQEVVQVSPSGSPYPLTLTVAVDPTGGTFLVSLAGDVYHVDAAGKATRHVLPFGVQRFPDRGLVVDARGRLLGFAEGKIQRYDRVAGTVTSLTGAGGKHFQGVPPDGGLGSVFDMAFGPAGDLYIADPDHRQVKRIPAALLD